MFLRTAKGGSDTSSDEDEGESDEETVKVVKSAKTKRMDEMEAIEKTIGNALRISDYASVNSGRSTHSRLSTRCLSTGTVLMILVSSCRVRQALPTCSTPAWRKFLPSSCPLPPYNSFSRGGPCLCLHLATGWRWRKEEQDERDDCSSFDCTQAEDQEGDQRQ